jgi:hypothetical protein
MNELPLPTSAKPDAITPLRVLLLEDSPEDADGPP